MGTGAPVSPEVRDELSATIGAAARQAREAMELTQEDVSDLLGLSSEFYARIERGHGLPSIQTLHKMAVTLHVDADVLLGVKPPEENERQHLPTHVANIELEKPDLRRVVRRLRRANPKTLRVVEKFLRELDRVEKG